MNKKKVRAQALSKLKELEPLDSFNKKSLDNILKTLSTANGRKYNLRKLSEELIELADVCMKTSNKQADFRPHVQELIDEVGDVYTRMTVLMHSEGLSIDDIHDRQLYKANKYIEYAREDKYSKI
jgi:phosphoribosyl-ATP pyrophosphohydrolase